MAKAIGIGRYTNERTHDDDDGESLLVGWMFFFVGPTDDDATVSGVGRAVGLHCMDSQSQLELDWTG